MKFLKTLLFLNILFFYASAIHAELRVEAKKNAENSIALAVVPFGWQDTATKAPLDIAAIVSADLNRSGYFKTLPEQQMLIKPTSAADVNFRAWQILGQEYVAVGKVDKIADNYAVVFQLLNVSKKELLIDYKISADEQGLHRAAHEISHLIYEKITGKQKIFDAKIAFVSTELNAGKSVYKLEIADLSGFDAKIVISSSEPIMSPALSPDGEKIAYVSFESQHPVIFVQTLATAERKQVAAFSGINGAPAWSPDGKKLAITLSKDGNPNIYIITLETGALTQLTKMNGINTEAAWSPDGQTVVFTSDESGKPQLYKISSNGGEVQRLTFEGEYNSNASFSPDGQKIAMVHGNNNRYKIAVLDMNTAAITVLTAGDLDESPKFSRDGTMILYAAHKDTDSVLATVSADGKIQQKLDFKNASIRDPSWMP